ncbi:MAG TPA: response regulator transcription factor, partial [Rheinheimera sp.]
MTLRVLLVDDQMLIRQGIKSLLQLSGQVDVVAEAPDGSTVVDLVQLHKPDVVLLDLSMPKV